MIRYLIGLIAVMLISVQCYTQDIDYVRNVIDSLTSTGFNGRGYVNGGDKTAADFIVRKLTETGVQSFNNQYYQYYSFDINSFPGKMEIAFDEIAMDPGKDFIVASSSSGVNGTYKTLWLDKNSLKSEADINGFMARKLNKTALILDTGFSDIENDKIYSAKIIVFATTKTMVWDVSEGKILTSFTSIDVSREKIPAGCNKIKVNIENEFRNNYPTQNVAAYISGSVYPDSFVVFTAHYDHLGRMGSGTLYPGANDNASGCAMLLDLARYYAKPENKPAYSIAFLFFSGEEAGLLGSKYYSENPLFPLNNIRFLLNMDMVSTGSEGIKVVNGSVFKDEFNKLSQINDKETLLKSISARGEAANSDHHWFYKKGVKCFFIYTLGNEWKEYHTPTDIAKGLPLTEYTDLFNLMTGFVSTLEEK